MINTKLSCRYWSGEQPDVFQERVVKSQGVNVFIAVTSERVYGPYYFDRNIDHAAYIELLDQQLLPDLLATGVRLDEMYFQQDGAPAHRHGASLHFLRQHFGNNLISLNTNFEWPPRSPDLTPLDYFVWGVVKYQVYQKPTRTLPELRQRIEDAVRTINAEVKLKLNGIYSVY